MIDDEQVEGPGAVRVLDERSEEPDSGVEREEEDDSEAKIDRPFNPEKIRIQTATIVVEQLVSRIRHNEIRLTPDFQRLRGIWKPDRKSRLMESLLLRIPLPVFYVAADRTENWTVVDGLQRMSTISDYAGDRFALAGLEYLTHLSGKVHGDLPRPMQRRIGETQLVVNVIEPGTPDEVMFNIFHRINTGGMPLNRQEIRHALNPGPVRDYLKELASSEEFLDATCRSIKPTRMADRDCILRFLAFYMNRWEDYTANEIDGYLDGAMKAINRMTEQERESMAERFRGSMRAAKGIFDDNAFRKINPGSDRRAPVNRALFGGWSVGLARRSPEDIAALVENREYVVKTFVTLLEDDHEFDRSISYSTSAPSRVRKQFQAIQQLIEEGLSRCSSP